MGVRFRLYGCERMRRERLIGECVVSFTSINLELETTMWVTLEPRVNLTVSIHLQIDPSLSQLYLIHISSRTYSILMLCSNDKVAVSVLILLRYQWVELKNLQPLCKFCNKTKHFLHSPTPYHLLDVIVSLFHIHSTSLYICVSYESIIQRGN